MKKQLIAITTLALLTWAWQAAAQIPRTLSYQGVLTDASGKTPRPDGNYNFTFRFYTSPTGGTAIWSESKSLPVKNGLFSTELGKQTPFGAAVKFDQQYWLGIQVSSEPELSPRMALTSVGYSLSSLRADTARIALASIPSSSDTTWRVREGNVYRLGGNVGIGTESPKQILDVVGNREAIYSRNAVGGPYTFVGNTGSFGRIGAYASNAWQNLILAEGGNVGIGTTNPQDKLNVAGDQVSVSQDLSSNDAYDWLAIRSNRSIDDYGGLNAEYAKIYLATPGTATTGESNNHTSGDIRIAIKELGVTSARRDRVTIRHNGNVGIGTTVPDYPLDVEGTIRAKDDVIAAVRLWTGSGGIRKLAAGISLDFRNSAGTQEMTIDPSGNVGIGAINPTAKLEVAGRTKTNVLEITGGSDLAEPFEISESQPIPKGALVIIDEENPGQLKLSHQAYDKRVAGVVSGAGGINPGLTLTQEGVLEGGQNVALSGRVYALATAANGPIKPGDLLTTSEVPGHAMKATDRELWPGAVIGKAMSKLENGEGLVLVLVNLQ